MCKVAFDAIGINSFSG